MVLEWDTCKTQGIGFARVFSKACAKQEQHRDRLGRFDN